MLNFRFRHPASDAFRNAAATGAFHGMLLLLLGCVTLAGRAAGISALTSLHEGWPPLVLQTTVCFLLCGTALAARPLLAPRPLDWLRIAMGSAVFLIGSTVMLEIFVDTSWIDFNSVHGSAYVEFRNPGQMAPTTAFCFMLAGILLAAAHRVHTGAALRAARFFTDLLFATGMIGILSYAISLEFLYSWAGLKGMAMHTGAGVLVLAMGIRRIWHVRAPGRPADQVDVRDIYRTCDILLTVAVFSVGLAGFGLSQDRTEKLKIEEIGETARDRRAFFDATLRHRIELAGLLSTRPVTMQLLRALEKHPEDSALSASLARSAQSILQHGFSALAYTSAGSPSSAGPGGRLLASAGIFIAQPELRLPIAGRYPAELMWKDGFILRTRLPMRDDSGVVGYVTAEQPLPELTRMQSDAIRKGSTGDMVICGLEANEQVCFPFRWRNYPARVHAYLDGKPLPVTRAVHGETASAITLDFRRQRVMVAFGPIGGTGLGMAVKMDMSELYAPLREQFFEAIPFLALLVVASVLIMRSRLRPLVQAIENSRREFGFMAQHDALTGLPNRLSFERNLARAMQRSRDSGESLALLFLDIDHFKQINDSHGHEAGDRVLRRVASCLLDSVRGSDTVARLGGDEFVIILEHIVSPQNAERIAQNIQKTLATSATADADAGPGTGIPVGASIGIALYDGGDTSAEQLMRDADAALYQSKRQGRNRYSVA